MEISNQVKMFEKGTSFVLSPVVSISTLFKPSFWFNDCIDSTKIDQTQQREGGERAKAQKK